EQTTALDQKLNEFIAVEFADALSKLTMPDLPFSRYVPVDLKVVRRIDEHRVRGLFRHQPIESDFRGGVTAEDTVVSQLPDVACFTNRDPCRRVIFIVADFGLDL